MTGRFLAGRLRVPVWVYLKLACRQAFVRVDARSNASRRIRALRTAERFENCCYSRSTTELWHSFTFGTAPVIVGDAAWMHIAPGRRSRMPVPGMPTTGEAPERPQ